MSLQNRKTHEFVKIAESRMKRPTTNSSIAPYAEKEAAAKALLSDLICEVENGTKGYDTALKEAYTKIYQTINPAYVPNEEIGIDRIYLDIPAADTVMFTQARKLLKEAQTRSVQK